jgi:general secretion pathway protein J
MKARRSRGMTLLEIVIAVAILGMISLLLYGALDSLSRGKRGEAMRADRSRQGREAMTRMMREMSSAFLSLHKPLVNAQDTRTTVFIARGSGNYDRVDFASFANLRLEREARESDQMEVGYFVAADPNVEGKMDLVRRQQTPIDTEPKVGGVTNVLAENIESFKIRFLDSASGNWVDAWDTTQSTGQPNRLPVEVHVVLVLKGVKGAAPLRYETKFMVPIREALTFGLPR